MLTEIRRQTDWPKAEIIDYAIRRMGYSWGILNAEYDQANLRQAREGPPSRRRRTVTPAKVIPLSKPAEHESGQRQIAHLYRLRAQYHQLSEWERAYVSKVG